MKFVPEHGKYWSIIKITGGPFSDFSGGFVIFESSNYENALSIINKDPFVIENLIDESWLNEWFSK
jgi:uncharacterized protein YciI